MKPENSPATGSMAPEDAERIRMEMQRPDPKMSKEIEERIQAVLANSKREA